jgi:uncharacterized Tic20 family protein
MTTPNPAAASNPEAEWYWSQRGTTLGPIDFEELRRLASIGSIGPDTWVYESAAGEWRAASSIPGLFVHGPSVPPPDAATAVPPVNPEAARAVPSQADAAPSAVDPRTAAIICRASVMLSPFVNVVAVAGPIVIWALAPKDRQVVAEAKSALNCMLIALIVWVVSILVAIVGAIFIVGPIVAGIVMIGTAVYLVVNGIRGIIAASRDERFEYPWLPTIVG